MRNEYRRGLEKLNINGFESKAAKEEWEEFRNNLSPALLASVANEHWT